MALCVCLLFVSFIHMKTFIFCMMLHLHQTEWMPLTPPYISLPLLELQWRTVSSVMNRWDFFLLLWETRDEISVLWGWHGHGGPSGLRGVLEDACRVSARQPYVRKCERCSGSPLCVSSRSGYTCTRLTAQPLHVCMCSDASCFVNVESRGIYICIVYTAGKHLCQRSQGSHAL